MTQASKHSVYTQWLREQCFKLEGAGWGSREEGRGVGRRERRTLPWLTPRCISMLVSARALEFTPYSCKKKLPSVALMLEPL